MAVIVQYIVEKNGTVKMTFDNKKEAEAYDKTLDIAADLWSFLEKTKIEIAEDQMEDLCMFLATNKDETMAILKGSSTKGKPPVLENKSSNKSKENSTAKDVNDKSAKTNKNKKQAA